jgi:hypothetical protein
VAGGGMDHSGSLSDRFSFDGEQLAAIHFGELVNQLNQKQTEYDPLGSQEPEATWAPPPLDDSFFDELPQYTNYFFDSEECEGIQGDYQRPFHGARFMKIGRP